MKLRVFFYIEKKDIEKCKLVREKWLNDLASKPFLKKNRPVVTPIGDFPSVLSAAKAIGINRSTLVDRIKRGWEGYKYSESVNKSILK